MPVNLCRISESHQWCRLVFVPTNRMGESRIDPTIWGGGLQQTLARGGARAWRVEGRWVVDGCAGVSGE